MYVVGSCFGCPPGLAERVVPWCGLLGKAYGFAPARIALLLCPHVCSAAGHLHYGSWVPSYFRMLAPPIRSCHHRCSGLASSACVCRPRALAASDGRTCYPLAPAARSAVVPDGIRVWTFGGRMIGRGIAGAQASYWRCQMGASRGQTIRLRGSPEPEVLACLRHPCQDLRLLFNRRWPELGGSSRGTEIVVVVVARLAQFWSPACCTKFHVCSQMRCAGSRVEHAPSGVP